MVNLQISGSLEELLTAAAKEVGRTPEEFAVQILANSLDQTGLPLGREVIALLKERIEAADRGEFVPQEQVERFFDEWQAELDARAALEEQ